MSMRIEPFKGVYIRAHHGKWHRSILNVVQYADGREHSYPVSECGVKVYSPWGIQQTVNQSKAYGFEGRDLCKKCMKAASPKKEN